MFLVRDGNRFVFLHADPSRDGYDLFLIESDVWISGGFEVYHAPDPRETISPVLGRSPDDPKQYKRFRDRSEMEKDKFIFAALLQDEFTCHSWSEYLEKHPH